MALLRASFLLLAVVSFCLCSSSPPPPSAVETTTASSPASSTSSSSPPVAATTAATWSARDTAASSPSVTTWSRQASPPASSTSTFSASGALRVVPDVVSWSSSGTQTETPPSWQTRDAGATQYSVGSQTPVSRSDASRQYPAPSGWMTRAVAAPLPRPVRQHGPVFAASHLAPAAASWGAQSASWGAQSAAVYPNPYLRRSEYHTLPDEVFAQPQAVYSPQSHPRPVYSPQAHPQPVYAAQTQAVLPTPPPQHPVYQAKAETSFPALEYEASKLPPSQSYDTPAQSQDQFSSNFPPTQFDSNQPAQSQPPSNSHQHPSNSHQPPYESYPPFSQDQSHSQHPPSHPPTQSSFESNYPPAFDSNHLPSHSQSNHPPSFDPNHHPSSFDPNHPPSSFDHNHPPSSFDPNHPPQYDTNHLGPQPHYPSNQPPSHPQFDGEHSLHPFSTKYPQSIEVFSHNYKPRFHRPRFPHRGPPLPPSPHISPFPPGHPSFSPGPRHPQPDYVPYPPGDHLQYSEPPGHYSGPPKGHYSVRPVYYHEEPELEADIREINQKYKHLREKPWKFSFKSLVSKLMMPLMLLGVSIPALGYMYSAIAGRRNARMSDGSSAEEYYTNLLRQSLQKYEQKKNY